MPSSALITDLLPMVPFGVNPIGISGVFSIAFPSLNVGRAKPAIPIAAEPPKETADDELLPGFEGERPPGKDPFCETKIFWEKIDRMLCHRDIEIEPAGPAGRPEIIQMPLTRQTDQAARENPALADIPRISRDGIVRRPWSSPLVAAVG